MPHAEHEKHLCKLWADSYNVEEVRKLVKNPQFICRSCGRAATKRENLCDPTPL